MNPEARWSSIRVLSRSRPRNLFLRFSLVVLGLFAAYAWVFGGVQPDEFFTARRRANLRRFLTEDLVPGELRDAGFAPGALAHWVGRVLDEGGAEALLATLWISVLAVVFAGLFGFLSAPLAARNLMQRDPFVGARAGGPWELCVLPVRALWIAMRAIPVYVWAFLLLALLGPRAGAWPAVLALAVHNAGILGRLAADTLENLPPGHLAALRSLGAGRWQLAGLVVPGRVAARNLLYFLVRFETCVREASVLGLLGVLSIGYCVEEAHARQRYGEMLLLIGLGALLVLAADGLSWFLRRILRESSG